MSNLESDKDQPGLLAKIWGTGNHAAANFFYFGVGAITLLGVLYITTSDPEIFDKALPVISSAVGFVAGYFKGHSCPQPGHKTNCDRMHSHKDEHSAEDN